MEVLDEKWIVGSAIRIDEEGDYFIRGAKSDTVTLMDIVKCKQIKKKVDCLEELIEKGKLHFLKGARLNGGIVLADLSEADQMEVAKRYWYVREYYQGEKKSRSKRVLTPVIKSVAEKKGDENPPSWNTLNNWINRYEGAGLNVRGLYPSTRPGNKKSTLKPEVIKKLHELAKRYASQEKKKVSTIYKLLEGELATHNFNHPHNLLTMPVYDTVKNYVRGSTFKEELRARHSRFRAMNHCSDYGEVPTTQRILERVEIDHTPLDIFLLHDDHKTLIGKPTLTALIDHYSRMIVGFQISFLEPSFEAVSIALQNAVLDKTDFLERCDVTGEWPAHGVMEVLFADNGPEFWSGSLETILCDLNSILEFAKVRNPQLKSGIERFFGTVRTAFIDLLPGKSNGIEHLDDEYIAQHHAKLTVTEFQKLFLDWLVNNYHRVPVGDRTLSPLDMWKESEEKIPIPSEDTGDVKIKTMLTDSRTLTHKGIEYERQFFDSQGLREIYNFSGNKSVVIKVNPFDIGSIYILDPINNIYIEAKSKNYKYAKGLPLYTHKQICKAIDAKKQDYLNCQILLEHKSRLFLAIDEKHNSNAGRKRQVTTKKQARMEGHHGSSPAAQSQDNDYIDGSDVTITEVKVEENKASYKDWGSED